jgi:beta-barrel assembly-enhancing protease
LSGPAATRLEWEASYLDGRTAARRRATIRLMKSGLEVTLDDGRTLWWPYADLRQTQGRYAGEQVRLERGGPLTEVLLVPDAAFLESLHALAPELTGHFHDPGTRRFRVQLTVLAALAAIGVATVLYLWVIPALAIALADRVPVAWEARLGKAVADQLAPESRRCPDGPGRQAVEHIVRTLVAPLGPSPYTFRVVVADSPKVNAFAAPGGYVVLFRGLVERTRTPEELAGVLAHELQHVVHRHATRGIFHRASTGLTALTGDATAAVAYGVDAARVLGSLSYSRQAEEEADADGLRLMAAAGIDPAGMLAFFETLKREAHDLPGALQYLSTHPSTDARISRLRSLAVTPAAASRLLPDADWPALARSACGGGRD